MAEKIIRSIDFNALAQRLYRHLQSDAIAMEMLAGRGNSSQVVDCFLEDDVLRIFIHLIALPSLQTSAIFSCARDFLERAGILNRYEVKIHLVVDEEVGVPPSKTLLAPLSANFEKRMLATDGNQDGEEKEEQGGGLGFLSEQTQGAWILISLCFGFGVLLLGGYALTRPCVIGSCPNLNQAEQITQSALIALNNEDVMDWLTTKQQLKQAIALLEPIPPWSPVHQQTTLRIAEYQQRLQTVEVLSQAVRQAQQAKTLMQNNLLAIVEINQAINLLQSAITAFRTIPQSNAYSPFTKKQLQATQQLLFTAQQRLLAEQQAEEQLNRATENAVLAKIRSTNPQSLADLNLIALTWKTVLQNLQQIPVNTTVYGKAQKQLQAYNLQYQAVETRRHQEEVAQLSYQEAMAIAAIATKAGLENQWSVAVGQWQNAVVALNSIPRNSFIAAKAQTLLTPYSLALQEAQNKLKIAVRSQGIKQQLENLCSQWIRVCDYTIGSNVIKVRLTPAYVKQIWDSALQAKAQGNVIGQTSVLNHISHLEQNLQMISNQSGLPLELYHAKGNRLSRYQPNS